MTAKDNAILAHTQSMLEALDKKAVDLFSELEEQRHHMIVDFFEQTPRDEINPVIFKKVLETDKQIILKLEQEMYDILLKTREISLHRRAIMAYIHVANEVATFRIPSPIAMGKGARTAGKGNLN